MSRESVNEGVNKKAVKNLSIKNGGYWGAHTRVEGEKSFFWFIFFFLTRRVERLEILHLQFYW